jgi:hypothetical protein
MEYLRATSDDEMGKIGLSPPASAPTRKDRVLGTPGLRRKLGHTFVVILDCGPATAFGLRLVSTPRTKTCPRGPRFWLDFRPQRCPRES